MAMQVTLFHANDQPLEVGVKVELLGDGKVIARGTVGEGGVVSFDAPTDGVEQLAVRLSHEAAAAPARAEA